MRSFTFQKTIAFLGTLGMLAPGLAQSAQTIVTQFKSPSGLIESCYRPDSIPGDARSPEARAADQKQEEKLCQIDFYSDDVGLCPKTWSTSAGTMLHDLSHASNKYSSKSSFSKEACALAKGNPVKKLGAFKQTMNQVDTSATTSASSPVYYQLSRYLGTSVSVPVAVMRTMDREAHYDMVTGQPKKPLGKMNAAAWNWLGRAETNPSGYALKKDLLTSDLSQIYGTLLRAKGERYGPEFNGLRTANSMKGQNLEFQETMPFLAVKSSKPLLGAIEEAQAKASSGIRKATGTPSSLQMLMWMSEVTEIAFLDYVMSQQDRVGNIDFEWYWYSLDDQGKLKVTAADSDLSRASMGKIAKPAELANKDAVLLQRTIIGDNDAGGQVRYGNLAKSTGMLEGIRHMNPQVYRRILALTKDLSSQGEMYQHLKEHFSLSADQMKMFATNAQLASQILQGTCNSGQLRFDLIVDLKPGTLEVSGKEIPVQQVGCSL